MGFLPANRQLLVISYSEMWDRLSYYGLQSLIILYLTKYFLIPEKHSYAIYGTYTALSFALSILGGAIADKLLGVFYAVFLGGILIFAGNIALACPNQATLFLGLAAMAMGVGLFKPNVVNMLGKVFDSSSSVRDKAFSTFYIYINIGGVLGPILYGFYAETHYYYLGFIFGALGTLTALFFLILCKNSFQAKTIQTKPSLTTGIILLATAGCFYLIENPVVFSKILWLIIAVSIIFIIRIINKLTTEEKNAFIQIFLPVICCLFFMVFLLQIYSSVLLFIDRYVNRNIANWKIPSIWFASLEPIFLILIAPAVNRTWEMLKLQKNELSSQNKIQIGLLFTLIAFYIFSLSAFYSENHHWLVLLLVIIGNFSLAIAELCIIPVGLSFVNLKAPIRYQGISIGIFYFVLTLSGYFSGFVAKLVVTEQSNAASIAHSFFNLGNGIFLFLLITMISRVTPAYFKNLNILALRRYR